jgi:hypothetical protein
MHDVMHLAAPWAHLALDQVLGFVGLLFFSFFGLLGALTKFNVRMLPFLVGATIIWGVAGIVVIGGEISPLGLDNIIKPQGREAFLAVQFVKRVAFAWFAGTTIGSGLIVITLLYEKYSKSRAVQLSSLLVRAAVFVVAFWLYLRTYVLRG